MGKKRVLVIGDCNSIFVKNYIDTVLVGEFETVLIIENPLTEVYREYYESHDVKVEPLFSGFNRIIRKIPYLRSTLGCRRWVKAMVKKYGHFDFVHIHGVCDSRQVIGEALRPFTTKLIVSVWGDELLRRSDKQLEKISRLYDLADFITMVSDKMITDFVKVYGNKYSDRISKNVFAVSVITDLMDDIEKVFSREELCHDLGIKSSKKINVFIGHNGRTAQRHLEITSQMKKLSEEAKSRLNLVYSMSYGADDSYILKVKNAAEDCGCSYTIIQGYKSEKDVAKLRLICDVLLHAQLTDAGSASIRECFYGGAIIVNGDWLPYNSIPDYHNRVVEYHNLNELPIIVEDIVIHFDSYKRRFATNKKYRYWSSTEEVVMKWKQLLN